MTTLSTHFSPFHLNLILSPISVSLVPLHHRYPPEHSGRRQAQDDALLQPGSQGGYSLYGCYCCCCPLIRTLLHHALVLPSLYFPPFNPAVIHSSSTHHPLILLSSFHPHPVWSGRVWSHHVRYPSRSGPQYVVPYPPPATRRACSWWTTCKTPRQSSTR